jgi:hypothetical protein
MWPAGDSFCNLIADDTDDTQIDGEKLRLLRESLAAVLEVDSADKFSFKGCKADNDTRNVTELAANATVSGSGEAHGRRANGQAASDPIIWLESRS